MFGLLVVELQSQLDVPRRLSARNLPNRRSKAVAWSIELRVVEGVDEVCPELHFEPLGYWEVLVYTRIHIGVTRRAQTCELRRTGSEARRWLSEVPIVGEPLTAHTWQRRVCNRWQ